jgi:hypothetical protein
MLQTRAFLSLWESLRFSDSKRTKTALVQCRQSWAWDDRLYGYLLNSPADRTRSMERPAPWMALSISGNDVSDVRTVELAIEEP